MCSGYTMQNRSIMIPTSEAFSLMEDTNVKQINTQVNLEFKWSYILRRKRTRYYKT